ncbi:ArsR/SmtB family transcription factor [Paenibacillus xanthanilyticus]|uniref:ArsR/SmtB family transcription factor n=1 Tax=Paenibacillus xanthanilyticus TaxID=1783531 RepID=A0ABV8JWM9_9BACL
METTLFGALADASRLRMVELLRDGPLTVGEIAARLALRQPQASKHLRVLLDAGIVDVEADGNRRRYVLRGEAFRALDGWLAAYLRLEDDRMDRLAAYVGGLHPDACRRGANERQDE